MPSVSRPRVLLVDALCLAYRSFYAIPALATGSGQPTNAVLGFIKTLQQIQRRWQPTHGLVAFDGGRDERKSAILPEYKAQRPPMPGDLRLQLSEIDAYLDAARVPRLKVDAREADDVLATAAAMAQNAGADVLILSSDKDILQLVDEGVAVVLPGKPDKIIGPDQVREKTGVLPAQMPDWLALTGDASDNIPGIPGVGPKTAAKWLNQYGSIAEIWQHLDGLTPERFRDVLRNARPEIERNLDLVRLDKFMALPTTLPEMILMQPDFAQLGVFFQRLEFHSMLKNMIQPDIFTSL